MATTATKAYAETEPRQQETAGKHSALTQSPKQIPLWANRALPAIQFSLKVNGPGDRAEQEAERMANQVMRTPDPPRQRQTCSCGRPGGPDGICEACKPQQQGIQKMAAGEGGLPAAPPIVHQTLAQPGRPLDGPTRRFMESRFGHNFGNVRVHTGEKAEHSADVLAARAYTVGQNVIFGEGQYSPTSRAGRQLLAHELAHVIQQRAGGLKVQRTPTPEAATEDEQREFVRMTAMFLTESAEYLGHEQVTITSALFERLINNWFLMVTDRESMIQDQLGGDALLQRELRAAYIAAIRVLIRRAAQAFGRSEGDLYRENSGRIPLWAWETPHHRELGISTPIAQGRAADPLTGEVQWRTNGIEVTMQPDTVDASLGNSAKTKIDIQLGNIQHQYEVRGGTRIITGFTGPPPPQATIQTTYGTGVTAASTSGYGRGTTPEDVAGGRVDQQSTSLGFHEGHHGLDYVEFLENNPPPVFGGQVGMTEAAFLAAITQYRNDWQAYKDRADRFSTQRTDCVGTSIDTFHQNQAAPGAQIELHCTP